MNPRFALLITILLVLAVLPWAISSCSGEPLMPVEIQQEPEHYRQTVEVALTSTRVAMLSVTPARPAIIILGTTTPVAGGVAISTTLPVTGGTPGIAAPAEVDTSISLSLTPDVAIASEVTATITPMPTPTTTLDPSSAIRIVSTAIATQTVAPNVRTIVVQSTLTPVAQTEGASDTEVVTETSEVAASDGLVTTTEVITSSVVSSSVTSVVSGGESSAAPYRPSGIVDVEDILTEDMLIEQANRDMEGGALSNVRIDLTPDGFRATATTQMIGALNGDVEALGHFVVENDSLVVKVSSIEVSGMDVTSQHRAAVESSVTSSLYRLLPQRFVQSYEIDGDEIIVQSLMRP